jgi:acyl-CoA thioesterase I
MKKTQKYCLILSLMLALAGCHEQKLVKLDNDAKILAFGDSLTYGFGAPKGKSWPDVLAQKSGHIVINDGISGNTTEDGIQRFSQSLEDNQPSLVILSLGGNDMLRQMSHEKMIANLKSMIETAEKKGIQVVLLAEPQPAVTWRLHDADFYTQIAKEEKIPVISDVYSSLLSSSENKSDLIHLNATGYEKAGNEINEKLEKIGAW